MCFSGAKRLCQKSRLTSSLTFFKTQNATLMTTAAPFSRAPDRYNTFNDFQRQMKDVKECREQNDKWTEEKWAEFKRHHWTDSTLPPWMSTGGTSYGPSVSSYGMGPYSSPAVAPYTPHIPYGMNPWLGLSGPWAQGASVSAPSWSWSGSMGESMCDPQMMMTRSDVTMLLLYAKKQIGISFKEIAKAIKKNEVFTTAAILGQHSLKKEEAGILCDMLKLDKKWKEKIISLLTEPPLRGLPLENTRNGVPIDPTIYRWFEMMQVYGTTFKTLLNEKFGSDGIMSSVDMTMDIDKEGSDRVKVTITAPFVPFRQY